METATGKSAIGVDVGGSRIRAALVADDGRVQTFEYVAATTFQHAHQFIDWVRTFVERASIAAACPADAIAGIGLALPGLLDLQAGVIRRSINVPWLEKHPIRSSLETLTRLPVRLLTDAEAATWGEYMAMPTPPERFVHLRLGTGVAMGAVLDGRLVQRDASTSGLGATGGLPASAGLSTNTGRRAARGTRMTSRDEALAYFDDGRRGHLDVLVVDETPDAAECRCGRRGCLEAYLGRPALLRLAAQAGIVGALDDVARLAAAGNMAAVDILGAASGRLIKAIENINARLAPSVIAVGGGVFASLPSLLIDCHNRHAASEATRKAVLCGSSLGDRAGVIGAALIVSPTAKAMGHPTKVHRHRRVRAS